MLVPWEFRKVFCWLKLGDCFYERILAKNVLILSPLRDQPRGRLGRHLMALVRADTEELSAVSFSRERTGSVCSSALKLPSLQSPSTKVF